jgi:uncharacterized protein YebE (UPF0316 family)
MTTELLLLCLLIFSMRILDVSIGTVRVIYTIRGNRLASAVLGFAESAVWIFAISKLFAQVNNPAAMLAWASGFTAGTVLGMTIEKWIATGQVMFSIFAKGEQAGEIERALRATGLGVTRVFGEGRDGPVPVLYVAAPRRRSKEVTRLIDEKAPDAFVTIEPISRTIGGTLSRSGASSASSMLK